MLPYKKILILGSKQILWTIVFFSWLLFPILLWADKLSTEEKIVGEALSAIDLCLHWGGEIGDQSEERNNQIAEGVERDCPEAKKKTTIAYKRFPNNEDLAEQILELHDFGYFDLMDEEKRKLCEISVPIFKTEFKKTNHEDPFVKFQCPNQAKEIYKE